MACRTVIAGRLCAPFVVGSDTVAGQDDVERGHVSERLTRYKRVVCTALPKTAVGKIDKLALKMMAERAA